MRGNSDRCCEASDQRQGAGVPPLVSRIERLGALSPVCAPVSDADLTLTAAQAEQLVAFLQEKGHEGAVLLRGAST
jgi:hypothetical protein